LIPTEDDRDEVSYFHSQTGRWPSGPAWSLRDAGDGSDIYTWNARLLRDTIAAALVEDAALEHESDYYVPRWRSALAVAEAFEAKEASLDAHFERRAKFHAYLDARKEAEALRDELRSLTPRTVQGVAILLQLAAFEMGGCTISRHPAETAAIDAILRMADEA
jgi:hypothetical protein